MSLNNIVTLVRLTNNDRYDASLLLDKSIRMGKIKLVEKLINNNVDVNNQCDGDTPLTLAIKLIDKHKTDEENENFIQIAKLLIKAGADINLANQDGIYPVLYASFCHNTKILDYLLDLNVDLNVVDYEGNTPLHYAAYNDCSDTIKRLVSCKVNLESINSDGATPLEDAVDNGHLECVKILIEAGANLSLQTLVDAIFNEDKPMIDLLIQYGVDTDIEFDEDMVSEIVQYVKETRDIMTLVKEPAE